MGLSIHGITSCEHGEVRVNTAGQLGTRIIHTMYMMHMYSLNVGNHGDTGTGSNVLPFSDMIRDIETLSLSLSVWEKLSEIPCDRSHHTHSRSVHMVHCCLLYCGCLETGGPIMLIVLHGFFL